MTHLRIEQNENAYNLSARELVDGAIILKLYLIVTDPNNVFDLYSHLKGYLNVDATYLDYIDVLTDNTKYLTRDMDITATKIYLRFADPEVESVLLANNIGDGAGITLSDLSNISSIGTWFLGNTDIVSFNELGYTNVHTIGNRAFNGCTSLTSIDLSNVTSVGSSAFKNCTSLTHVDLSKITSFPNDYDNGAFLGCTSLLSINTDFSNVIDLGNRTFYNCTSLGVDQDLVLYTNKVPESLYGTKYKSVVIHSSATTKDMNFNNMPELLALDYSDTQFTGVVNAYYSNKLELVVLPPTITSQLSWRFRSDNSSLSKIILLATTPPDIESTYYWYMNGQGTIVACDFYVPDNVLNTYKTANKWSDISTHIKGLSELPVGIWKTGLYQLYEPYLSHSSDPAYATT